MEKSGFFNSSSGDRVYSATDFAEYFGDLVSNGIFYRDPNNLLVTAAGGMSLSVAPGSAWINGYHYSNTSPFTLQVPTANGSAARYDRVILRLDYAGRAINLAVKSGNAGGNAPDLDRNHDVWELGLATIYVYKSVVSISQDAITDTRLMPDSCGMVNSLVTAVYE